MHPSGKSLDKISGLSLRCISCIDVDGERTIVYEDPVAAVVQLIQKHLCSLKADIGLSFELLLDHFDEITELCLVEEYAPEAWF